jgi:hypothetical protein
MTASSSNIFQRRIEELNKTQEESSTPEEKPKEENVFQKRIQEQSQDTESWWDTFLRQSQELVSPTPEQAKKQNAAFREGTGQTLRAIGPKVIGLPGDFYQFTKGMVAPSSKEEQEKRIAKQPFTARGAIRLAEMLPTSESLTKHFDTATEGEFLPKTKGQERFQEMTGDAALLLGGPAKMAARGLVRGVLRPIGGAIAGTLSREAAESMGFEEKGQAAAKIAAMLFASSYSPGTSTRYRDTLYRNARELRGNDITTAASLENSLNVLERELQSGLGTNTPTKAPVLADINAARQNIRNGQISIEDLENLKRDINTNRSTRVYEPEVRGRPARRELRRNYDRLSHAIDETVNEYGQTNPDYLATYREANLAHSGILASENARNFIRSVFRRSPASPMVAAAVNHAYPGALMKGAIGATLLPPALRGYQFAYRLTTNPALRRNYTHLMEAAIREDAKAVLKYSTELADEMKKDKKNYPF